MRLSEELARIMAGGRRKRRPPDQAPSEIVPSERPDAARRADPFDAARERLRSEIEPPDDSAQP